MITQSLKKNLTQWQGAFVETIDSNYSGWGTGKLVSVTDEFATIRFFDSPDPKSHVSIKVPLKTVRSVSLSTQTRVYRMHSSGSRWQAGRVLQHDDHTTLLVQFPNGESLNVEVNDLEVRWNKPIVDPLPFLIAEATDTPFLAEARSSFVRETSKQHSVCSGMTSILSAAIELEDYQFNVARRILTDPIQRYLLADEVGLGKTIEACIVIRQFVLDEPNDAMVVVVAPDVLLPQWQEELTRRFFLGPLLGDFIHLVGHTEIGRLRDVLPKAGLIVVDEAHHLSRQVIGKNNELYDLLQLFATKVPRLLLLSATPVLSDTSGFLRVMHLLDPVVFPLEDHKGFKRRLESRQLVAEVVSILTPENLWSLPEELDRLSNAFNDDPLLEELISNLRTIIEQLPEEDDENFIESLSALRIHLSETYRLHRRVLRNRRVSVPWATIRRKGLQRVEFRSLNGEEYFRLLDDFRLHLAGITELEPHTQQILFRWAVQPVSCFEVEKLLSELNISDCVAKQLALQLEQSVLSLKDSNSRFVALSNEVRTLLAKEGQQIVVFCDSRKDADRAMRVLEREFGSMVQRHDILDRISDEENFEINRKMPWMSFLSSPEKCRVLVCDARSEEGINLHGGSKVALHFDLPPSPNRIEQRLGRLDRYGTGNPVRSVVLVDSANPNEMAWLTVLEKAWEVFDRSVASLQYLIEETIQQIANEWSNRGFEALAEQLETLAGPNGRVSNEIRRINQQDTLDAIENPESDLLDELSDYDQDWQSWRTAFVGFVTKALMFDRQIEAVREGGDETFRIGFVYKGSYPTLLPVSRFLNVFLEAVDFDAPGGNFRHPLTHRYAFQRRTVTSQYGLTKNIHLLRIGDPFVTALERFCEVDDRGRAFGLWRVRRDAEISEPSGVDLYFRFDFVVKPRTNVSTNMQDSLEGVSNIHRLALSRLAGATLPPLFFTVWVSGDGVVVNEPPVELLESYKDCKHNIGNVDINLNPGRWRVLHQNPQLTWLREWESLCVRARDIATKFVLDSSTFKGHVNKALSATDKQHKLRLAQGRVRIARTTGQVAENEAHQLAIDDQFYRDLSESLSKPTLRLEDVGAVFLANHSPFTS